MHNDSSGSHFTDVEVARLLGINPASVRRWRTKNKEAGCIKYGPPYEYHGNNVRYPKQQFREWCAAVTVIDGVPHLNFPMAEPVAAISQSPVTNALAGVEEALRAV